MDVKEDNLNHEKTDECCDSASCSGEKTPEESHPVDKEEKTTSDRNILPENVNKDALSSNLVAPSSVETVNFKNSTETVPNSADSSISESASAVKYSVTSDNETTSRNSDDDLKTDVDLVEVREMKLKGKRKNSDVSTDEEDREEQKKLKDDEKYDPTPSTPLPVHNWSAPKAILARQYGSSSKYSPDLFRFKTYGSLHMVQRLELMYKMTKHDGCVNALNFNSYGTKLVSGSDDMKIIMWDWTTSEPILEYNSGHTSNVFQAKFLPQSNDYHIVTCARDGQIRLGELSSEGFKSTRQLAKHISAAHKLGLHKDNPHVFMSCAEDGFVFLVDIRSERKSPVRMMVTKEKGERIPLYTLAVNPLKSYEYVVGGRSSYARMYDTRFPTSTCVKKFCPEHLVSNDGGLKANVTSVVYNYNGEEVLASYNEDIYLFNSHETDSSKYMHRYRGHRNNQTIKGVNFFGSKSEYVVSGSDCGFIFFWDKESEHIVKYMYGDEMGVVNCMEPHPNMPVLATSGLDDDIKIWVPSCEYEPDLSGLKKHVINNMKVQEETSFEEFSESISSSLLFLMQHLSSARFQNRPVFDVSTDASSNEGGDDDEDDDDNDDSNPGPLQCAQS